MLSTGAKGHPHRKGTIYDAPEMISLDSPFPLPLVSLTGNPPSDFFGRKSSSGLYYSRNDLTCDSRGSIHCACPSVQRD